MPVNLAWQIEGYILYLCEYGIVDDPDLQAVHHELRSLLNQLDSDSSPIHLILDQRDVEQRTPNIDLLKDSLSLYSHPTMGWTVVISEETPFWRFLNATAKQYTTARLERVRTPDDALAFLREVDRRLERFFADDSG